MLTESDVIVKFGLFLAFIYYLWEWAERPWFGHFWPEISWNRLLEERAMKDCVDLLRSYAYIKVLQFCFAIIDSPFSWRSMFLTMFKSFMFVHVVGKLKEHESPVGDMNRVADGHKGIITLKVVLHILHEYGRLFECTDDIWRFHESLFNSRSQIKHFTLPSPIGIHFELFISSNDNNASDNKLFPIPTSSIFSTTIPDSDEFGISSLYSL